MYPEKRNKTKTAAYIAFFITSEHLDGAGNLLSWNTVNIMITDDLATKRARGSATMILSYFARNSSVSLSERLGIAVCNKSTTFQSFYPMVSLKTECFSGILWNILWFKHIQKEQLLWNNKTKVCYVEKGKLLQSNYSELCSCRLAVVQFGIIVTS